MGSNPTAAAKVVQVDYNSLYRRKNRKSSSRFKDRRIVGAPGVLDGRGLETLVDWFDSNPRMEAKTILYICWCSVTIARRDAPRNLGRNRFNSCHRQFDFNPQPKIFWAKAINLFIIIFI